jgi:ribosomal protein S18 acetylase RimI-like enzyme
MFMPTVHLDQVVAIFQSRPDIFPPNEIDQIKQDLKKSGTDSHYKIVAMFDYKVVGYCGTFFNTSLNYWYIDWLSVHPQYKRRGIGHTLLSNIVNWLSKKRINRVCVETCSCSGEADARHFYNKQGFEVIRTEIDGYAKGHSKLTYMKKILF